MNNVCCFLGHRKIDENLGLREKLYNVIENLIIYENIDTFLFGSKSKFDSLCHDVVSQIKEKYPHIKRVYVRAEYPYIDDNYKAYLLKDYEDTYYPQHIMSAAKAVYIERNYHMIDKSRICVVYFSPDYEPPLKKSGSSRQSKSGTKIACEYAKKKGKMIINILA